MVALAAIAFIAIFFFDVSFPIIIIGAGVIGYFGAKSGRPEVLTFCLDDNYGWDDGLICGGRMSMLVDPLVDPHGKVQIQDPEGLPAPSPVRSYYQTFHDLVEKGQGCTEAVVIKEGLGPAVGVEHLVPELVEAGAA